MPHRGIDMRHFPMTLSLDVIAASMSTSIRASDGDVITVRKLHLVLRADRHAKVRLSSGDDLSKVAINFTISSEWRKPSDFDLGPNDVGSLCYSEDEREGSFVDGGAIWPSESLPESLLHSEIIGSVNFTLANVSVIPEYSTPFVWERNAENLLRISSVEFCARRSDLSLNTLPLAKHG